MLPLSLTIVHSFIYALRMAGDGKKENPYIASGGSLTDAMT